MTCSSPSPSSTLIYYLHIPLYIYTHKMERVTAIINSMHYIHVKVEVYMHVKKKTKKKERWGQKRGASEWYMHGMEGGD